MKPMTMTMLALSLLLSAGTARAEEGAATPEELVAKAKEAMTARKMSAMVPLVHPEDRPLIGFGAMMMAAFSTMGAKDQDATQKELDAINAKHGVKEGPKDAPPAENEAEMTMRMRTMFKGVDIAAYVKDMEAFAAKYGDKDAQKKDSGPGKIENIKVEGDTATVTMDGKPGKLAKVNGRWYLRMSE